ncbi:cytoplasmic tRNA 2-thiolation protein 2 isoform X2 [Myotis myotis]|uniref:cytoplasmic tRNA 2-thiolation protein 2 isoform X2 n=1 Tax=Myotis myotis TaxID=51298 RepID=UPI00174AFBF5|nr:cytoplasmic tRNA 2-thiolation protein 2 isoform X2 [Myotis myotis]
MCQVGEEYGAPAPEVPPPPPPPRAGRELKCVKCSEGLPVVVIRAGDAFCRDCFKAFYVHKFRAVLGKNRLIFPGEKVLLAWSGGPSSSSMIWQVLEGLSRDSAKRLRFVPGVVYVDEGAACGQSPEDRAKTLAEMKLILQTVGFPWHIVALEEVFGLPPSVLRHLAQEPSGTKGAYKAAVDSFLQQQHAPAPGEEQLSQPGSQDPQGPAGLPTAAQTEAQAPTAAQTEALSRLFDSVKTLTAKEELLQTLRTHLILHVARTHGYSKVMTGDSCTRLAIKLMTSLALGRGAFLAWDTGFSDERHGDVVVVRPMRDHTLKEVAFYNRLFAVPSVFTPAIDTKLHRGWWYTWDQALGPCTEGPRPGTQVQLCSHREDPRASVIEQLCYGCRVNMKDLPSLDPLPPYILTEAQLRSQRASVLQEIQEYLIDSDDEVQTGES